MENIKSNTKNNLKLFGVDDGGFTLIELLVVISIIGILSAVALFSFTATQKQARDTQRKSDIKQFQNALEIFSNANSSLYPSRADSGGADASSPGGLCADLNIGTCPVDPRVTEDPSLYVYRYQSDGSGSGSPDASTYVLWAKMEAKDEYFVVCSTGKVGALATVSVSGGVCPL